MLKVLVLIQSVCWFGVINIEINIGDDRDGPLQLIFVDLFWLICTYKICKVFTHTPELNNSFFKLPRSYGVRRTMSAQLLTQPTLSKKVLKSLVIHEPLHLSGNLDGILDSETSPFLP